MSLLTLMLKQIHPVLSLPGHVWVQMLLYSRTYCSCSKLTLVYIGWIGIAEVKCLLSYLILN